MIRKYILSLCLFALVTTMYASSTRTEPIDYVSTLVGTQSTFDLSAGNTYPAIAMPWGMNFWMPQTAKMGDGWAYTYDSTRIRGFKQTHQPSPWINDYGQFSLMPVTGKPVFDEEMRASWFSHKTEIAKPHYYKVYLSEIVNPQIGRFGSILKYYQEMLAFLSPPIVASFILGIFSKRVNGQGVFIGLISGLIIAILLLIFKADIFGNMHFLFIVPILFVLSSSTMYIASLFYDAPKRSKLDGNIFTLKDFKAETLELKSIKWYANYRIWGIILLCISALMLLIFS